MLVTAVFPQAFGRMSLLAMDTSMFDVFAFDPPELQPDPMPEPRFREKLEIKPARHQEQQSKVCDAVLSRWFSCMRLNWNFLAGVL